MKQTIEQRFWKYVDRSGGPDSCWEWAGSRRSLAGYGQFHLLLNDKRATVFTHRMAWQLTNGPIPPGLLVCHKCDNPPCCNPAHLFLGTCLDNTHDAMSKSRMHVRLTAEQVRAIISEYATGQTSYSKLAHKYGIAPNYASYLVRGMRRQSVIGNGVTP